MDSDSDIEIKLWELVEVLFLRTMAQKVVIERLSLSDENWQEAVERAEILHAPMIHAMFSAIREELFGVSPQDPPAEDWSSIVRNLLDD
jgi:hypothetical protein